MKASVLVKPQSVVVEERPLPALEADEVLVRVSAVGVCGSDVHYFQEGRIGDFVVESPLVLGHEAAGTIVAAGSGVDPSRVGERVSIEPQRPDPHSKQSLAGCYNLDPSMRFYATPPVDGAFMEFVKIQSHFAFTVPDSISDEAAALMEPLSVGIAAMQKAQVTPGAKVLITGAGPIGIICAQVAKAYGATEVIVSDLDDERRRRALTFGADRVIDPKTDDVANLGLEVGAFIEASGATPAILTGIRNVAPAGRVVLVGMGADEVALPLSLIQNRELVVTGIFRYANTWPIAIELVRTGRVDLDGLVTGVYGIEDVAQALADSTKPASLKTIVRPGR
ncbi:NAD(P)-dependent alcohol dehydrogenase [Arthrobacter mobilis]|uniref:NAD(P)-dependent alcohol dehydrogenase n=1 Tax=Arthrobacter mobilis TaxID=2724944 RepID=A0A7X6K7H7_9MICC|nr:NAD(P)-dependent alcohol dehydrogenase [Arthrobacter mobilis]NKX56590.1 NAD(P)-dependent alcohol dehydrogenase [Arthrobacter mobilis]